MRRHNPLVGARCHPRRRRLLPCVLVLLFAPLPVSGQRPQATLDAFLERVAQRHEQRGAAEALAIARARGLRTGPGERVSVILEPRSGRSATIDRRLLARLGASVASRSRSRLRVRVPVRALRRLARHPDVALVRAPLPVLELSGGLGGMVSESVSLTGAAGLQQLGLDGAGVRVAVVDLGFTGLSAAIGAGELPNGTITLDYTGTGLETGTAHGTVVAEHILDMAPGVELHCLKVGDLVDLENAADYARTQGIDIVNHSVGWAIASYYDDTGPVSDLVNQSRDVDGVFWVVASGNNARRHWRGGWLDSEGDDYLDFVAGDDSLRLSQVSSSVCLYLNWNQYGQSNTNLDLFVTDRYGLGVASSQSLQNGGQAPVEQVCFPYSTAQAPYDVAIERVAGPTNDLDITLFSFFNEVEYPIASAALMDPAPAHGAFTVGSVNQWDWGDPWPPIQLYSSQGPTTDGRLKPDVIGPDGTSSSTYGVQGAWGTSFSAGTAAGAAALLLQNDPTRTPDGLALDLAVLARDVGPAGPDPIYGNGALSVAVEGVFPDDADGDGVVDVLDNCPFAPNPGQSDVGGVSSLGPDGIGDACQCADVTGDGVVLLDDLAAIQQHLIGVPLPPGAAPRCNAIGAADGGILDCSIIDVAVVRRALAAYPPGIGQVCSPALP